MVLRGWWGLFAGFSDWFWRHDLQFEVIYRQVVAVVLFSPRSFSIFGVVGRNRGRAHCLTCVSRLEDFLGSNYVTLARYEPWLARACFDIAALG